MTGRANVRVLPSWVVRVSMAPDIIERIWQPILDSYSIFLVWEAKKKEERFERPS